MIGAPCGSACDDVSADQPDLVERLEVAAQLEEFAAAERERGRERGAQARSAHPAITAVASISIRNPGDASDCTPSQVLAGAGLPAKNLSSAGPITAACSCR